MQNLLVIHYFMNTLFCWYDKIMQNASIDGGLRTFD